MWSSGVVIFYNVTKRYGFISPDDGGENVFVHQSALRCNTLTTNQPVQYTVVEDEKGRIKCDEVIAAGYQPCEPLPYYAEPYQTYRQGQGDYREAVECRPTLCYFDLETTGLKWDCEILSISAITFDFPGDGTDPFNVYTMPCGDIDPGASKVNGFTKYNGNLFLNGKRMDAVDLRTGLEEFLGWLQSLGTKVMLIAHNAKRFDTPRLKLQSSRLDMQEDFEEVVEGFICSLQVFKAIAPGLPSYTQPNLYKHFVDSGGYDAHKSHTDVLALKELVDSLGLTSDELQQYSFTW